MDRGAWGATVHRVTKIRSQLKRLSTHACTLSLLRGGDETNTQKQEGVKTEAEGGHVQARREAQRKPALLTPRSRLLASYWKKVNFCLLRPWYFVW